MSARKSFPAPKSSSQHDKLTNLKITTKLSGGGYKTDSSSTSDTGSSGLNGRTVNFKSPGKKRKDPPPKKGNKQDGILMYFVVAR